MHHQGPRENHFIKFIQLSATTNSTTRLQVQVLFFLFLEVLASAADVPSLAAFKLRLSNLDTTICLAEHDYFTLLKQD